MKRSLGFGLLVAFVLFLLSFPVACAKKSIESDPSLQTDQAVSQGEQVAEPQESAAALEEKRLEEERAAAEEARRKAEEEAAAARERFLSEDIHFDFDSAIILGSVQGMLQRKADWMNANPEVKVVVEGHCDERGTEAYNLALGERRAEAARNYLVDLGVDSSRLSIISFGEEQPVDPGQTEQAWAKNRRAHFKIEE